MFLWLLALSLLSGVGFSLSYALDRLDQRRAERARVAWERRRAERRLHDLASRTFIDMVGAARDDSGEPGQ